MKEQISALIDGETSELERQRTLRALRDDPTLVRYWERYHLVSTAMRRELDFVVSPGLADRIQTCLMHEQPASAPRFLPPRMLKLTAGIAIAASVAAVAILNLTPLVNTTPNSVVKAPSGSTTIARSQTLPPEKQRVLNPYLVHHAEFSSALSVNSMGAFARVVGRDSVSTEASAAE